MRDTQATRPMQSHAFPDAEALLTGTMALMTGYSHARPDCPMRPVMAAKLARNLSLLSRHPDLSDPMRNVLGNMYRRWQQAADHPIAGGDGPLWHHPPSAIQ